jgi:hypothetical protein
MKRFERTGRGGGFPRSTRVTNRVKARGSVFRLEWLEDRVMLSGSPSIYVVNSTSGADTGTGNTGTLPFVVGLANSDPNTAGSVIEFDPTVFDPGMSHTIDLQATIRLEETAGPEVIKGPGASVATVSGDKANGVVIVSKGVTATISNLTIAGGKDFRGAGINNEGDLDLAGCTLESNSATKGISSSGTGGAIFDGGGASLAVTGSTFHGNSAAEGGGIFVVSGTVTIGSSFFDDNTAGRAGVIYNHDGAVKITDSTFDSNTAQGSGGALINIAGTLDAANCAFSDNRAVRPADNQRSAVGGVLYIFGGQVSIAGCTLSKNDAASGRGGGIYVGSGKLTISSSSIVDNSAETGGGIWNQGSLTINDAEFTDNRGVDNGGAIDNVGQMNIVDSGFTSNSAGGSGGAIANSGAGAATMSGCTVASNVAVADGGGGIFVSGGQLTLINSTVASNTAASAGGIGVGDAQFTAINDTIADNDASEEGLAGGVSVSESVAKLYNTIVAQNTSGSGAASDIVVVGGTVVSGFNNLVGTGGGGGLINGQDGNQVGVADPGLGSLGSHGGPTKTISLLAGSRAIDAGSDDIDGVSVPAVDQRGAVRGPAGLNAGSTVDVGAYEASSSYLVTSADDSFAVGTLRTAAGWANVSSNANPANLSNPAPNTIVFDTDGVFSTPQTITLNPNLGTLEFSGTTVPAAIDGPGPGMVAVSGGGNVGVFQVDSDVTAGLIGLTVTDGASGLGGGVNNAGDLTIQDCVLSDNSAFGGGGISNTGDLTLMSSTLEGNLANQGFGGGISNNGTMAVVDSALSDNTAAQGGGAIANNSTLTLTNVTIAGNAAGTSGGGIDQVGGALTAVNVTITGNSVGAVGSGGGLDVELGSAALYNTIVALNTKGTGTGAGASDITVASPRTLSGSFNLIGTGGSGGLINGVNDNQVGVANPLLGTLANNGGPTQTIAVLPGSPAIGAGSSSIRGVNVPPTDQRGVVRPANSVDVGAFQDQGFELTVVAGGSPQTTALNTAFANPLTVVVTSLAGDPVAGGVMTFTAPSSGASAVLTGSLAQIGSNGQAAVTAVANGVAGSYVVTATTGGAVAPARFNLTNQAVVGVTGVTVKWGTVGTEALVVPGPSGGILLPPDRSTDLPWLGISQLIITLNGPQSLTRNDVTISSAIGYNYGPTSVTGSGKTYAITLGRPIKQADIVTVLISGAGVTPFTAVLPVLPGDFNDDGTVDNPDRTGILNEMLAITKPTIFGDINGDGLVNRADYDYVVSTLGTKLPPMSSSMTVIPVLGSAVAGGSSVSAAALPAGGAAVAPAGGSSGGSPQAVRSGASPFAVSWASAPRAEVGLTLRSKVRVGGLPRRFATDVRRW